jgi:hypothetical protein
MMKSRTRNPAARTASSGVIHYMILLIRTIEFNQQQPDRLLGLERDRLSSDKKVY